MKHWQIFVLLAVGVILSAAAGVYVYIHQARALEVLPQTQIRTEQDLPRVTYAQRVGAHDSPYEEVTKPAFGAGVVIGPSGNEKIPENIKSAGLKGGVTLRMTYAAQWFIDYAIEYPTYPKILSSYPGGILYLHCFDMQKEIGEEVVLAGRQCDPGEVGLITPEGEDVPLQNWASN